jgi:hypothetical protein
VHPGTVVQSQPDAARHPPHETLGDPVQWGNAAEASMLDAPEDDDVDGMHVVAHSSIAQAA